MGKQDENVQRGMIQDEKQRSLDQSNTGINQTQQRVNDLTTRSDAERQNVLNNYNTFASTGGVDSDSWKRAMGMVTGGGSGGSGGGGGGGSSAPDYLQTFRDLQTDQGAFDPARMKNLTDTIARLKGTDKNFGATDTSIGGLQDFAKTGGVSTADAADIQNPVFREFAATGGYSGEDLANIRARSNAGIGDTYRNMQDSMLRRAAASGNMSPGLSSQRLRLARQGAQDIGTNVRGTEMDIRNAVNQGRMSGAQALSSATQGLAGLRSQNTLAGYTNAGNLDEAKQKQIADALAASGGLDLNTQQLLNNTKLAATSGLSQDALGRMSIGASSAAAQNALDAANARFMLGMEQQGKEFGSSGLLDTYKAAPGELMANQNLLYNYRGQAGQQQQGLIGQQGGLAASPGWEQSLGSVLGGAGNLLGGIGKFFPMAGGTGNPGGGAGSSVGE